MIQRISEIEDEQAFQNLARAYPQEMYTAYPERFWEFFQVECPGVDRSEMERLLEAA